MCTTKSAPTVGSKPLHVEQQSRRRCPNFEPGKSLRQATSLTTPCTQGYLVAVHATVRTLPSFNPSDGISAPGEGVSLWVAAKSSYNGRPVIYTSTVITLRWSGRPQPKSVVRPRPPLLVVFITAYWCVATTLRATVQGCRLVEQIHQARLWVKKKTGRSTPPLQEGVGDGSGGDTSGDGGGGDTSGDGGGGDTSGDGGGNEN